MQHILKTANATKLFASRFAKQLIASEVLALTGPLGAGKTTFVQGLAKGFGIKDEITSPTFVGMTEYAVPRNSRGIARLVHIDVYRLTPEEATAKGILDTIGALDAVTVIEWGEKLEAVLPEKTKWVRVIMRGEGRIVYT